MKQLLFSPVWVKPTQILTNFITHEEEAPPIKKSDETSSSGKKEVIIYPSIKGI
ncbi:MAG: hypothetical protein AABX85_02030 [Nanoarchaeota archaeon]